MPKKKNVKVKAEKPAAKKKIEGDTIEEESMGGEDATIDPAIIEDTFTEEFSEYNDVDNF